MPLRTRRALIAALFSSGVAATTRRVDGQEPLRVAVGDRAHFRVRPQFKQALVRCFVDVLGCAPPATLPVPGWPEPILAFRFPGGGSMSVEFLDQAPDERSARHGAWLEIRTNDVAGLSAKIIGAGLERVKHPATSTFYFVLPGGQVIGVQAG